MSAGYRDHPLVFAGGGRILVTGDWISLVTGVQRETHIHTVSTDIIMRVSTRHDTTVVMVGDTKVGKSALVNKFRTGKFGSGYNKTNVESFNTSSIVSGQRVKFTIYDTSGWFHYIIIVVPWCPWALIKAYSELICFRTPRFQHVPRVGVSRG